MCPLGNGPNLQNPQQGVPMLGAARKMEAVLTQTRNQEETIVLDPDVAEAVQKEQHKLSLRGQIFTIRALVNSLLSKQAEKERKVV